MAADIDMRYTFLVMLGESLCEDTIESFVLTPRGPFVVNESRLLLSYSYACDASVGHSYWG